jgi:hypothetical protein
MIERESTQQVLNILILPQIFNISYRSSGKFLTNHKEYLEMAGLIDIPLVQTLSRRARLMDIHVMIRSIILLHTMKVCAADDSFIIHTYKYSTAMRRKYWGNYKVTESVWSRTTKEWSYGTSCHMTLEIEALLIKGWLDTKGNMHDSPVSNEMVNSVRSFSYILGDSAYDTSDIYDYVFENTHSLPIIDNNKR